MSASFENVTVSVVIPVFNAERYLPTCIESLRRQKLEGLEYVFVDDCSTDGSLVILEQFARDDPRVRVLINETNLGEGGSRNKGIQAARGAYINSIDPDDWVASGFYELLYARASTGNYDVVKGTRISIDEDTMDEICPRSNLNAVIRKGLKGGAPLYSLFGHEHTTAIFSRKLFAKPHVRYGSSSNACDVTFLLRICPEAKSFALEEGAIYYYVRRRGSATSGYTKRRSEGEIETLREQIDAVLDYDQDDYAYEYLKNAFRVYASRLCHAYCSGHIAEEDLDSFIARYSEQAARICDCEKFFESNLEIKALVEERVLLPATLCSEGAIWKEELELWIAYLLAADGETRKGLFAVFPSKLASFVYDCKRAGAGHDDLAPIFDVVRMQTHRFSTKERLTILCKAGMRYLRSSAKRFVFGR